MDRNDYKHPEVLVETDWVATQLDAQNIRFIEMDSDPAAYMTGHIPNAINWDWQTDTCDPLRRNIPDSATFEALMNRSGITNEMTIILYGDKNNWFATYAFWLLKYYGHRDARLINGGRKKWIAENRPTTTTTPSFTPTHYTASPAKPAIRALRDDVLAGLYQPDVALVDVRSAKEYSGELTAPDHLPNEGAQRGGHIPGAVNITWGQNVNKDGTFKSAEALHQLYQTNGVTADKTVIPYCRIGERSSHTWFVLTYLLGYPQVRNYDGAWAEWGNLIDVPIER